MPCAATADYYDQTFKSWKVCEPSGAVVRKHLYHLHLLNSLKVTQLQQHTEANQNDSRKILNDSRHKLNSSEYFVPRADYTNQSYF